MSQEMEKNDQLENGISQDVLPKSSGFVENSLLEVGKSMARYSIAEVPSIPVKELNGDKAIANALSEIQVDDPNFKDLDPITDQGIFDIGAVAIAKAEAVKESLTNPKEKAKFTGFEEKIAATVHKLLATKSQLTKRAIGTGLSLALVACADGFVLPTITPDTTPGTPTTTEISEALSFKNFYPGHVTLSVPGFPENIATGIRIENMYIDSNIEEALNIQGYSPVLNSDGPNLVGALITVEQNKSVLVNAPESLINYGGVGKLGSEQGTVLYGTYGKTPYEKTPLARLLTLVPFEQNDGIYAAGAFVTKKIPGQELGSFVIIFFNANTGQVIQTLFAEFPENQNLRVEWQGTGPVAYFDRENSTKR